MARKRMIAPTIWQDPDFGSLSSDGQILVIGLISNADDEGRLRGNAAFLKSIIFVYKDYSSKKVEKIRNEAVLRMKNIILYIVDGEEYIQLKNWDKYQTLREDRIIASTFPGPRSGTVADIAPSSDGQLPAEVKGREVKVSEVKLGEGAALSPQQSSIQFFEMMNLPESTNYHGFLDRLHEATKIPYEALEKELKKFCNYWLERNKSGTKAKWELEKTFEVNRRLAKWLENAGKWSKEKGGVNNKYQVNL